MTVTSDPKPILIAGSIAAVAALIGVAVILNDRPRDAVAPVSVTSVPLAQPGIPVPQREKAPPVPDSIGRDGVYVAGRQIKTGTYTAEGGSFCYWARLKYTAAGTTSVLVSSYAPDRQVATIVPGDVFQTSGCGEWVTVR